MTEPEATCVVDSAKPRWSSRRGSSRQCDVSAAKPCGGLTSVMPGAEGPDDAPSAHVGAEGDRDGAADDDPELRTGAGACVPAATSASVMTPIVFCASLVPWASETREDVKIWPRRNPSRLWLLVVAA